jgi:hypothetical protein
MGILGAQGAQAPSSATCITTNLQALDTPPQNIRETKLSTPNTA